MKLSELKALVAEVEAAKTTEDPMIDFWIPRSSGKTMGPNESDQFVNYSLDMHAIKDNASLHRVAGCAANAKTVYRAGDFCLPLIVTPFYNFD